MPPKPLTADDYYVDLTCPRCGEHALATIELRATLTVTDEDASTLRARVRTKPVEHLCDQTSLDVTDPDEPTLDGQ